MKKRKMSFNMIKDVLSRDEMREIMAGSIGTNWCTCCTQNSGSHGICVSDCCYIPHYSNGNIICC